MTDLLTTLLTRTPPWVWLILAGLVATGLKQAADHSASAGRLLAQPVVLGALSLYSAIAALGLQPWVCAGWALGVATGVGLSRWLGLAHRLTAQADGRLHIAGSWAPMALMMLIFWLRYAVAVALAVAPALGGQPLFAVLACAAYGLACGLIGARAWRVLRLRCSPAWARPIQWASG